MLWRIYFKKHWVSSTCWFRNWSLKLNLTGCISTTTLWVFFPQLSVSMHGFSFLVDMWQCFCYLKVRLRCQLIPGSYLEPWGWSHETFQWKKRRRKAWYWFTCDITAQQRHRNNCSSCDAFTQSCNWLIQDSTILLLKILCLRSTNCTNSNIKANTSANVYFCGSLWSEQCWVTCWCVVMHSFSGCK